MKERRGNVSTKSQNLQKSKGQADLGNNGQVNLGMLKHTLRVGGKMIGTQQIRILKHQQPLEKFHMLLSVNCDFRILAWPNTLNLFSLTDWILRSELSHWVLIPLHAKLLFLPITCYTWMFDPQKFSTWMCVQHCRPRRSVWSRKEDPMHFVWNGKANGHRDQKSQLPTTIDGGH